MPSVVVMMYLFLSSSGKQAGMLSSGGKMMLTLFNTPVSINAFSGTGG